MGVSTEKLLKMHKNKNFNSVFFLGVRIIDDMFILL